MPNSAAADIDRRVKVIDGELNADRSIERVSDLRELPFVVLLGEPGMGKSTVLASEASHEGATVIRCANS
jgi:putative ribosome biogenesis GTPase RsgA